jgi:apolipoprotein N-acyltransferase
MQTTAQRKPSTVLHDRYTWLWLALAVIATLFSGGNWVIPLATWIGPVFALRFVRTQPTWRGWLLLYLVSFAVSVIGWWGVTPPSPSPWMHVITMGVGVLAGTLAYLLDRLLVPRLRGSTAGTLAATLVFPFASTAVEYLTLTNNPVGSWGAVAYTQFGNPVIMQVVSVLGLWGVTFLVGWLASLVNWAWEQGLDARAARRVLAAAAVGALLIVTAAYARFWLAPGAPETVRVAAFTEVSLELGSIIPVFTDDLAAFRRETAAIHGAYLARSAAEAQAGAKIVLWPEGVGIGVPEDVDALVERGRALARAEGIYLAMPVFLMFPGEERVPENRLLIADPAGEIVLNHVKYGGNEFEGTLRGDGMLQVVDTPYGRLSGVICWDTDFPAVVRQAGQQGVDILLSPAHDWEALDPVHGQMTAFRAAENGMTVVRIADQGFSLVTDPYGRTLAAGSHFAGQRTLVAAVPTSGTATIYAATGDALGWLSVVGLVALAVWAIMAGRRARSAAHSGGVPSPA